MYERQRNRSWNKKLIGGDKIERKLFEKDKLTYIALNKKLHIGVESELRLIEEED